MGMFWADGSFLTNLGMFRLGVVTYLIFTGSLDHVCFNLLPIIQDRNTQSLKYKPHILSLFLNSFDKFNNI